MNLTPKKKAFTLLEVIFVIVILGIVASIGSSIIVQLYENYIVQRAMHRVSLKTELAANQIMTRLMYRIDSSVITRDVDGNITVLGDVGYNTSDQTPESIEWIVYDNDSFSSKARPGWSGYCDTNATLAAGGNTISTPGSALTFTNTVIGNLSAGNAKDITNSALLFSVGGAHISGNSFSQKAACYGYNGDASCIHQIAGRVGTTALTTDNAIATGINISPHYKLAWTAYAIVPVNIRSNKLFDLELRYNYQPWDGIQYDNAQTSSATLIKNVTSFKFSEQGGTVRFKLCATEQIAGQKVDDPNAQNVSICKEKVVIR